MKNVDFKLGGKAPHLASSLQVAETEIAAHGNAREAERAVVGKAGERSSIALDPGIADHPDFSPELGLADCKIVDVAEQAADGRVQAMQNAKRGAHGARTKERTAVVSFRRSLQARK
jgi:hypothetical protein